MKQYKTDYIALQNLWFKCSEMYLDSLFGNDKEKSINVVEGFIDSLVDIDTDGKRAIRKNYDLWEKTEWIPLCKNKLSEWIKSNPFEARVENNKIQEYNSIKMDYNFLRYHKILQLIQDSGIGLGQARSGGGSFDAGVDNIEEFTG